VAIYVLQHTLGNGLYGRFLFQGGIKWLQRRAKQRKRPQRRRPPRRSVRRRRRPRRLLRKRLRLRKPRPRSAPRRPPSARPAQRRRKPTFIARSSFEWRVGPLPRRPPGGALGGRADALALSGLLARPSCQTVQLPSRFSCRGREPVSMPQRACRRELLRARHVARCCRTAHSRIRERRRIQRSPSPSAWGPP